MNLEKPDLNKAFQLLNQSAELNNFEALYAVGTWYLHGKNIKKNTFLATEYFLKSIEGNYSCAYYDLAICYENGEGVKRNDKKALECYLNAPCLEINNHCMKSADVIFMALG